MTQPALFTPEIPTTAPDAVVEPKPALLDLVRTNPGRTTGRHLKAGRCRACRAPILRGLDEDLCALRAETDPTPLAPLGEAMALLAGRKTYDLARDLGNWQLTRRGRWRIAGTRTGVDIVPAHRCHDHTLDPFAIPTIHTSPTATPTAADQAPY